MGEDKREFILRHLMQPGFMTHESQTMILEEKEDSGKSRLVVQLFSEENLWKKMKVADAAPLLRKSPASRTLLYVIGE